MCGNIHLANLSNIRLPSMPVLVRNRKRIYIKMPKYMIMTMLSKDNPFILAFTIQHLLLPITNTCLGASIIRVPWIWGWWWVFYSCLCSIHALEVPPKKGITTLLLCPEKIVPLPYVSIRQIHPSLLLSITLACIGILPIWIPRISGRSVHIGIYCRYNTTQVPEKPYITAFLLRWSKIFVFPWIRCVHPWWSLRQYKLHV